MSKEIILCKPHSSHVITFTTDEDPHFTNVRIIKRATGEVKGTHYILTSDVPTWIEMYTRDRFKITEGAK